MWDSVPSDIISAGDVLSKSQLATQSGGKYMQGRKYDAPDSGTSGLPKGTASVPIGNGVAIVLVTTLRCLESATGLTFGMRRFVTKAGQKNLARRGSVTKEIPGKITTEMSIEAIANLMNLVVAYELIKSKPGNMTPGVDSQTLDGMDLETLRRVQRILRAGKYAFPPARRIEIPKPGKPGQTRPLTIASPRDKIVQKAILNVMEPHYDPQFLDSSHGFRPGKGTHTAMLYVDAKFQSSHYIIEADFSKAFDSICHSKLMVILARQIKDEKLLKLIRSGLKAGWMDKFGKINETLGMGTPQGSILSPLLCNIFLNELDVFMEALKEKYRTGAKPKNNKIHESLTNKIR